MIVLITESCKLMKHISDDGKSTYSKIFRWSLPKGETHEPARVEVVGSFTDWKKVSLTRDHAGHGWHLTLHHIPGNRTHHYMVLADGKPVQDRHCDGLAAPQGAHEERFAIHTPRGPRVFILFGQTK